MTWLSPGLALWGAAIAVPLLVLLYFLKLRRQTVDISTTLLWRRAVQDLQANAPFQRLRRNILLLLQLLALASLLAALGQPEWRSAGPLGAQHIILIDRSASMNARTGDTPDAPTRLDRAKQQAAEIVGSLRTPGAFSTGSGDRAMVIAVDSGATVLAPMTSDRERLLEAIASIEPTDAPGRLLPALRLARAQDPSPATNESGNESGNEPGNEPGAGPTNGARANGAGASARAGPVIHLLSDGSFADADAVPGHLADRVRLVRPTDAESGPPNLGIVALRAHRSLSNPERVRLFLGLQSTAAEAREVEVEFVIADQRRIVAVAVEALSDQGPGRGSATIEVPSVGGEVASVTILHEPERPDALSRDDRAWVVLPPPRSIAIALVSEGDLFLESAVTGTPGGLVERFTPDAFAEALAAGESARFDVLVLDGSAAAAAAEPDLPRARSLVLGFAPPGSGVRIESVGGPSELFASAPGHPAVRDVTFAGVELERAPRLSIDPEAGAQILAETRAGPAIVQVEGAQSRSILVAFDPIESTWPLDLSFPMFIAAAIETLAADRGSLAPGEVETMGSVAARRLPPGARNAQLLVPNDAGEPAGEPATIEIGLGGRVAFGPLARIGVYRLSWEGPAEPGDRREGARAVRPIASAMLDPRESDLRPAAELRLAGAVIEASSGDDGARVRRLWPWFILLAAAILLGEWWVYNRKVRL